MSAVAAGSAAGAAGDHGLLRTDGSWSRAETAAALANLAIACAIVFALHDSFWWPPDEGAYAYIADRLGDGDALNRDLHDVHAGYVHFLHALALELFGRDMLSLRYPLAALTIIQSSLIFLVLRPVIGPMAICGGIAMSALTFVQFLNPSANWYALFLTVVLISLLSARIERSIPGLLAIGFVIGLIFLFRQLSAVLIGIGTVAYLLMADRNSGSAQPSRSTAARILSAAMFLALATYLWLKADGTAFLLYGLGPLMVLLHVGLRARADDRRVVELLLGLSAGATIAFLPLLLYHLSHGSLGAWWQDTIVSAVSLTDLSFFQESSYSLLLALALIGTAKLSDPVATVNGAFWLILLLSPLVLSVAVLRALRRDGAVIHPLPFLAVFHALVSAHYAIPIYALFSAGLTLAGLLALPRSPAWRAATATATVFAVATGLAFQAAQPVSRGLAGIIGGERVALPAGGLPGARIRMEADDQAVYRELLAFIEAHAAPDDPILGLPMTPELYFLSRRKPPLRFVIAPLGLRSPAELEEAWRQLQRAAPAVLLFKRHDKYTTAAVTELMHRLRPSYQLCKEVGPFELYAKGHCKLQSASKTELGFDFR